MRRRIKDANGNYIWFDNEEEYQAYLQAIRNSWPNRMKRFFYKVGAVVVALLVLLTMVGMCSEQNKTKSSTSKNKTEIKKKNTTKESSSEDKSLGNIKNEEIHHEKAQIEEEQSFDTKIDAAAEQQVEQLEDMKETSTQAEEPIPGNPPSKE